MLFVSVVLEAAVEVAAPALTAPLSGTAVLVSFSMLESKGCLGGFFRVGNSELLIYSSNLA